MNKSNRLSLISKGLEATKFTVIYRLLAQGIGVFATIFLVRALTEYDYGIYNLLYSLIAFMGMFFSFGIANTLQRYIPEYYHKGEYEIAHRLYRVASLIRLISNVVVLGVILLLWEYLAPLLKIHQYKDFFLLFCLIILLHLQWGILETCLNSYFLQKYSQGISTVFTLVKGIGYAAALWLSWDLWYILIIDCISYFIVFTSLEIVYLKKIPKTGGQHHRFTISERKRVFRYALFYNFNDAGGRYS